MGAMNVLMHVVMPVVHRALMDVLVVPNLLLAQTVAERARGPAQAAAKIPVWVLLQERHHRPAMEHYLIRLMRQKHINLQNLLLQMRQHQKGITLKERCHPSNTIMMCNMGQLYSL